MDRKNFDATIDRLNTDLKAICDDFNSVKRENEALKQMIESSKINNSTQTDHFVLKLAVNTNQVNFLSILFIYVFNTSKFFKRPVNSDWTAYIPTIIAQHS